MPLTFLDGAKVAAWSRWLWALVFGVVAFLFWHIIINEDGAIVEAASDVEVVMMLGLMGFFIVLSGGTWLYFNRFHRLLSRIKLGEAAPVLMEPTRGSPDVQSARELEARIVLSPEIAEVTAEPEPGEITEELPLTPQEERIENDQPPRQDADEH